MQIHCASFLVLPISLVSWFLNLDACTSEVSECWRIRRGSSGKRTGPVATGQGLGSMDPCIRCIMHQFNRAPWCLHHLILKGLLFFKHHSPKYGMLWPIFIMSFTNHPQVFSGIFSACWWLYAGPSQSRWFSSPTLNSHATWKGKRIDAGHEVMFGYLPYNAAGEGGWNEVVLVLIN